MARWEWRAIGAVLVGCGGTAATSDAPPGPVTLASASSAPVALVPSTTATPSPPASPPATSADPDDVPRWARTRQCNRFIDAANASQEVFGTVAAAVGDAEAMADRRDAIVAGAREVEEVRITIPALVELQRRWVDGVYLLHDALRAFDDLSDPDRIAAASERLKANGDAMSELIDEVNAYCSGED